MSHQNTRGGYSGSRGRSSRPYGGSSQRQRHDGMSKPFANDSFGSQDGMSQGRGKYCHRASQCSGSMRFNGKPGSKYVYRQKSPAPAPAPAPDVIPNSPEAGGSDTKQPECFLASDLVSGDDPPLSTAECDSKTSTPDVIPNLHEAVENHTKQLECFLSSDLVCRDELHSSPVHSDSKGLHLDVTRIHIRETPKKEMEDGGTLDLEFSFSDKAKDECMWEDAQLPNKANTEEGAFPEKSAKNFAGIAGSELSVQHTMVELFDICPPKTGTPVFLKPPLHVTNRQKRNEAKLTMEGQNGSVLRSGMVLLKNYLSISDQVKIVKACRNLGLGPGGFYQPGYRDGARLHLKMMCLGKNWDPDTRVYEDIRRIDGAKPPIIPADFYQLVRKAIQDSHALIERNSGLKHVEAILPCMSPNICIVNFYSASGKLGLHQDRDETQESLSRCLPVVSFSIGDSAEFLYGDQKDVDKAQKVKLESGDVLIFGGKSRHIFHGVSTIIPNTASKALLEETNFRPGRLNLTFRQY